MGDLSAIRILLLLAGIAVALPALAEEQLDEAAAKAGEGIYRTYCASCHGLDAKGDGEVAEVLKQRPADLTRLSALNGGVFPRDAVIAATDGRQLVAGHGTREMPIWGGALKRSEGGLSEAQVQEKIRQLVHYIWSLQH